jgi:ABC-type polysaccharide/polyol phosphate export permease
LRIETLWQPVRTISWLLPATYAIRLLRDIMLRGYPPEAVALSSLALIGGVLFVVALLRLRRLMARR